MPKGHNHGRDQPSTCIEVDHEVDTHHHAGNEAIDSKVHWFRSHLKPNQIEAKKTDTKSQLADLCAKALVKDTFVYLRKLLMGW